MFAYPIIGGSSKPISLVTFLWLLDRWPRLADLIFSKPPEEPKHGYERYYEGVSMAAPIDEQLASLEKTLVQLTNSRRGKFKRIIRISPADRIIRSGRSRQKER